MTKISDSITFGGTGLDRAAHLRHPDKVSAQWAHPRARVLPLFKGKVLTDAGEITWQPAKGDLPAEAMFLALDDEAPVFAVSYDQPLDGTEPGDLRRMLPGLNGQDAALIAAALGCHNWHHTHRFCGRCGAQTRMSDAGWRRDCDGCGAAGFPRTDPVVIMLITDGDDILLGRSPGWPEGMYSLLAGFMEPGETIEAAVRRETVEEVGIPCDDVHYVGSQPWPLPGSLMIGCTAKATTREINSDPAEIEHARWFTRQEIAEAFAGTSPDMRRPNESAIAGMILRNWLADTLP